MKTLIALLALVLLFTLTSCGDDFDAEAEKEAVVAVLVGIDEDLANADGEAVLAAFHEDSTGFTSLPDNWFSWTYQDIRPNWFTEPEIARWDDYEVLVSPDLAVIKGDRTIELPETGPVHVFGTSVFKKEDGQWKLIHNHLSYGGP